MAIRKVISRSILDGTVAPVDTTGTASNISLTALSASIARTAVDVFVYDTRKDSDGGEWRKRTQHTSWYNETLNTATRGSRRDFPAVAVIVTTAVDVIIYDGDSPDLPMWMIFNDGGGWGGDITSSTFNMLNGGTKTSTVMMNGLLAHGELSNFITVDFISERSVYRGSSFNTDGVYKGNIAQRNSAIGHRAEADLGFIINANVNDVAITVLPNAPVDVTTGLPIPTIAAATDGGISLIQNTGSIHTLSDQPEINTRSFASVSFNGNDVFGYSSMNGTVQWFVNGASAISNQTASFRYNYTNNGGDAGNSTKPAVLNIGSSTKVSKAGATDVAASSTSGLTLFSPTPSEPNYTLTNYVTSKYNTGWMPGFIKAAWLSDSTAETATGTELVTNGTFDTNATGWTAYAGGSVSVSAGRLTVTSPTSGIWLGATQTISGLVIGKRYILTADIITSNNWGSINISAGAGSGVKYGTYPAWNGGSAFPIKGVAEFVATTTSVTISIDNLNTSNATVTTIDNISMKVAEDDRSVTNKGVQVNGTLTKAAVNTGNDLVAYSGFATGNYLQQPYNSVLDLGTSDMCVIGWIYNITGSGANRGVMHRNDVTSSAGGFILEMRSDDTLLFQTQAGGANVTNLFSGTTLATGWNHFVAIVRASGTTLEMYLNGALSAAATGQTARSLTNTAALLRIGQEMTLDRPFNGSLALLRISATVPSAKQISKMYNDEKVLFQTGAKGCLYGSSDTVTAITHDDNTQLLHVGTSAGRSVFDGLRRVDNTTTAVTTSISASNSLVAEQ